MSGPRTMAALLVAATLSGCASVPAGLAGLPVALTNLTTLGTVGVALGGANLFLNVATLNELRQQRRLECYLAIHDAGHSWEMVEPYCPDGMMAGTEGIPTLPAGEMKGGDQ